MYFLCSFPENFGIIFMPKLFYYICREINTKGGNIKHRRIFLFPFILSNKTHRNLGINIMPKSFFCIITENISKYTQKQKICIFSQRNFSLKSWHKYYAKVVFLYHNGKHIKIYSKTKNLYLFPKKFPSEILA